MSTPSGSHLFLAALYGPALLLIWAAAANISFTAGGLCVMALLFGHFLAKTILFGCEEGRLDFFSAFVVQKLSEKLPKYPEFSVIAIKDRRRSEDASIALIDQQPLGAKIYPWEGVQVSEPVNDAIEDFVNTALEEYVCSWYLEEISKDRAFLREVRYHIRYIGAVVARKLYNVDLSRLILDKAVPVAVTHAGLYSKMKLHFGQNSVSSEFLEQRTLDHMRSTCLHKAMHSRQSEMDYLRKLGEQLVVHLVDRDRVAGWEEGGAPNSNRDMLACWGSQVSKHFLRELIVSAFLQPVMDVIADPEIINELLILLFDPEPMKLPDKYDYKKVSLLRGLTDELVDMPPDSLLQIRLSDILHEHSMRYLFTSYIRDTGGPFDKLQFVLSAGEMQTRLREMDKNNPKDEELSHLHWEAWELYKTYLHDPVSRSDLKLDQELAEDFKRAVECSKDGSPQKFLQLLEKSVEQAYRVVYYDLQANYAVPFCQSELFIGSMCGAPPVDGDEMRRELAQLTAKGGRNLNLNQTDAGFTFSRFRSRFFNMFLPHAVEGSVAPNHEFLHFSRSVSPSNFDRTRLTSLEWAADASSVTSAPSIEVSLHEDRRSTGDSDAFDIDDQEDPDTFDSTLVVEGGGLERDFSDTDLAMLDTVGERPLTVHSDDAVGDDFVDVLESRDLTKWRIKVPKVEPRREQQSGRMLYVYVVTCERMDVDKSHPRRFYKVDRRYNEFYVLEAKLIEFHGEEFLPQSLPPKKNFASKGRNFVENLRQNFEVFLQRVCKKEELKASELLCAFLTSSDEFRENFLPDLLNPWRAMKKVPAKFSRERGQYLKGYLTNLVNGVLNEPGSGGSNPPGGNPANPNPPGITKSRSVDLRSECGSSASSSVVEPGARIVPFKEKLMATVFGNNCGIIYEEKFGGGLAADANSSGNGQQAPPLEGSLYDSLLFLSCRVLFVARWLFGCLVALRILIRNIFDSLVKIALSRALKAALHDQNVAKLTRLLKEAIFHHTVVGSAAKEAGDQLSTTTNELPGVQLSTATNETVGIQVSTATKEAAGVQLSAATEEAGDQLSTATNESGVQVSTASKEADIGDQLSAAAKEPIGVQLSITKDTIGVQLSAATKETDIGDQLSKEQKADLARRMAIDYLNLELPRLAVLAVGEDTLVEGVNLAHDCLQKPRLNKQLSYILLDILVQELFPDLKQAV